MLVITATTELLRTKPTHVKQRQDIQGKKMNICYSVIAA